MGCWLKTLWTAYLGCIFCRGRVIILNWIILATSFLFYSLSYWPFFEAKLLEHFLWSWLHGYKDFIQENPFASLQSTFQCNFTF